MNKMKNEEKKAIMTHEYSIQDEKGNVINTSKYESTKEIEELRKLRNECDKKAREYQKKIDSLFLELYEVPDVVGKLVSIENFCEYFEGTVYGKVEDIMRMNNGVRVTLSNPITETYMRIGNSLDIQIHPIKIDVVWDKVSNIKEISIEEILTNLNEFVENYKTSVENA